MIHADPPQFGVRDVAVASGSGARSVRVRSNLGFYESLEANYIARATQVTLWDMPRDAPPSSEVSRDDAKWVYESRMVPKEGTARYLYNALRSTAPRGKCVMCGRRDASTLDHVLPKSRYPDLAFTPANLVPACAICNSAKLATVATGAADQPIHAYFDAILDSQWLIGQLIEVPTAPVLFRVGHVSGWPEDLLVRAAAHFETYGLGNLYAQDVADTLGNYRHQLERELDRSGPLGVCQFLSEIADSYEWSGAEPWSVVALRAWANSSWFCEGGWRAEA